MRFFCLKLKSSAWNYIPVWNLNFLSQFWLLCLKLEISVQGYSLDDWRLPVDSVDEQLHVLPLTQDLGDNIQPSERASFMKGVEQEFSEFEKQGGFSAWITERHPDTSRRTGFAPKLDCQEMYSFLDSTSSMPRGLLQVYLTIAFSPPVRTKPVLHSKPRTLLIPRRTLSIIT